MNKSFFVAGVKFHKLNDVIDEIEEGQALELIPEPDNQYDPNALRIEYEGVMLGYVPKVFNSEVLAAMDLKEIGCFVEKVSPKAAPWERLFVTVKELGEEGSNESET